MTYSVSISLCPPVLRFREKRGKKAEVIRITTVQVLKNQCKVTEAFCGVPIDSLPLNHYCRTTESKLHEETQNEKTHFDPHRPVSPGNSSLC